jgi:hypothetical protein
VLFVATADLSTGLSPVGPFCLREWHVSHTEGWAKQKPNEKGEGIAFGKRVCGVARSTRMANLLERAIECNDGDHAAKIIQHALGIESDDVANYVFPKRWPSDREQRARIIGEWLQTEARFLA